MRRVNVARRFLIGIFPNRPDLVGTCVRTDGSSPGPTSRMGSIAWPFPDMSTPASQGVHHAGLGDVHDELLVTH